MLGRWGSDEFGFEVPSVVRSVSQIVLTFQASQVTYIATSASTSGKTRTDMVNAHHQAYRTFSPGWPFFPRCAIKQVLIHL